MKMTKERNVLHYEPGIPLDVLIEQATKLVMAWDERKYLNEHIEALREALLKNKE